MIREQKAPSGPRPDFSPSRTYGGLPTDRLSPMAHTDSLRRQENYDSTLRPRVTAGREPTLNASSRNNHSLFSFGGFGNTDENNTTSYEFLPSPSFDDLQSSINAASNDFSDEFPTTVGNNTVIGAKRPVEAMEAATEGRGSAGARVVSGPRPARTGSILRRQSTSTRQSSISSTTSAASGGMDPPSAPLAMRNRRQSQYPPISGSGGANAPKAPRKSIGPGVIDSDYSRPAQRRRPSLASSTTSNQGLSDNGGVSTRVNIGGTPTYMDGPRGLTASRAAKTKSLQPPSRQGQTHLTPNTSTPEHSRSSSFAGRSPGRQNGRGTNTPSSSSKRMSVVPGMPQANHATGLGARTISPTDARRAKRLSVLQHPPPMPHTPPTAQPDISIRNSSRSPSMLPITLLARLQARYNLDYHNTSLRHHPDYPHRNREMCIVQLEIMKRKRFHRSPQYPKPMNHPKTPLPNLHISTSENLACHLMLAVSIARRRTVCLGEVLFESLSKGSENINPVNMVQRLQIRMTSKTMRHLSRKRICNRSGFRL
jgi:dual specificity tyrosine-phosphorylation-regulated kinase 2/3/4